MLMYLERQCILVEGSYLLLFVTSHSLNFKMYFYENAITLHIEHFCQSSYVLAMDQFHNLPIHMSYVSQVAATLSVIFVMMS